MFKSPCSMQHYANHECEEVDLQHSETQLPTPTESTIGDETVTPEPNPGQILQDPGDGQHCLEHGQIITLMMASAQVVETSVNTNNSPSQDYTTNPDDHSNHNIDSPGFKPFTVMRSDL